MRVFRLRGPARVGAVLIRIGAPIAALLVAQVGYAPAPVAAANVSVLLQADQPAAVPKGKNWSFDDFFPRTLTVAQGSTIGVAIEGFHTATFLPAGETVAQDQAKGVILAPETDDTAPNPNGTTHAVLNVPALLSAPATGCGTDANPCTFDGTSVVSAGAPLAGPSVAPFQITISAAPGTYAFHCRVHPRMEGTITVVPAGSTVPTAAAVQASVAAQIKTDIQNGTVAEAQANAAGVHHNADGTTTWTLSVGTSSADGRTVILEMLPSKITIKPGDTVTWVPRGTNEVHTVTFPTDIHTDIVAMCENGGADTPAVPTKNPPTSPLDFACNGGPVDEFENAPGNGVSTVTSPATVSDSGTIIASGQASLFGVPDSAALATWTVHFTGAVAGTYTYVCQIHGPAMHGTITVLKAAGRPGGSTGGSSATPPPTTTLGAATGASSSPGLPLALALAVLAALAFVTAGTVALRRSR